MNAIERQIRAKRSYIYGGNALICGASYIALGRDGDRPVQYAGLGGLGLVAVVSAIMFGLRRKWRKQRKALEGKR